MTEPLGFQVTQLEVERDLLQARLAALLAALEAIGADIPVPFGNPQVALDAYIAAALDRRDIARQAISLAKEQTP